MSQLEETSDGIPRSPVQGVQSSTAVHPGVVGLLSVCSGVEVHNSTLSNFSTAWSFNAQLTYPCLKKFPDSQVLLSWVGRKTDIDTGKEKNIARNCGLDNL
jgi:hypothetical protein